MEQVVKVGDEELYLIRHFLLQAERLSLESQLCQNQARLKLLEVERKYGLLGSNGVLNLASGEIGPATAP